MVICGTVEMLLRIVKQATKSSAQQHYAEGKLKQRSFSNLEAAVLHEQEKMSDFTPVGCYKNKKMKPGF